MSAARSRSGLMDARRLNFRFSGDGTRLACLSGGADLTVGLWRLTGDRPETVPVPVGGLTVSTVPIPTGDDGVILCRIGEQGTHRLALARPGKHGEAVARELAVVRGDGLRSIPGPAAGPAGLAFVNDRHATTVLRLTAGSGTSRVLCVVPGTLRGGVWLDERGDRLAVRRDDTGRGAVLDLQTGELSALHDGLADTHLLCHAPRAGVSLVATRFDDAYRIGLHREGEERAVFPDRLNRIEGVVTPLALEPGGRRAALAVTRGARSHLLLHDLAADTSEEIDLPPGTLLPVAAWSDGGLHVVHSTPDQPPHPVRVRNAAGRAAPRRPRLSPWIPARLMDVKAAEGTMEAVVYGRPEQCEHVVMALHGGPEAAWQLAFEPTLQRMALGDIAVVAPNQRGSTGYGPAHRDAIRGVWGGPDLADVLALGRWLARARGADRPAPLLYGASYGAFLALLAAAASPGLWSRVAVVAPFVSGPALYEDGPPPVRALLDRLRGRDEILDELGPRDLLRLAGHLDLPVLIVHGAEDPIIPVAHSRHLRDRLPDLTYLEIPGAGHDPLAEAGGDELRERVAGFLRGDPPRMAV
ncbi:alpha/beta hydrolase family protein [Nonomuraea sp. NPDC050790]|uniref:alpha/beta hydrolase family protein n=1 Tax=Nonomuraea sp. NPDC050790 TaxID=3364371 RepID=UPI003798956C